MRQRPDERRAGLCQGPVGAADRAYEPPGGAPGGDDGYALHRVRKGQAGKPAGAGFGRDEGYDGFKLALPHVHRLRAVV